MVVNIIIIMNVEIKKYNQWELRFLKLLVPKKKYIILVSYAWNMGLEGTFLRGL